jgi:hypothetical protein
MRRAPSSAPASMLDLSASSTPKAPAYRGLCSATRGTILLTSHAQYSIIVLVHARTPRRSGETGRHATFRALCSQGHGGSSPPFGTQRNIGGVSSKARSGLRLFCLRGNMHLTGKLTGTRLECSPKVQTGKQLTSHQFKLIRRQIA